MLMEEAWVNLRLQSCSPWQVQVPVPRGRPPPRPTPKGEPAPQVDLGEGSGDKASPLFQRLGPVQLQGHTAGQQPLHSLPPSRGAKLHTAVPG